MIAAPLESFEIPTARILAPGTLSECNSAFLAVFGHAAGDQEAASAILGAPVADLLILGPSVPRDWSRLRHTLSRGLPVSVGVPGEARLALLLPGREDDILVLCPRDGDGREGERAPSVLPAGSRCRSATPLERAMLRACSEPSLLVDGQERLIACNDAAEQLLTVDLDAALGRSLATLLTVRVGGVTLTPDHLSKILAGDDADRAVEIVLHDPEPSLLEGRLERYAAVPDHAPGSDGGAPAADSIGAVYRVRIAPQRPLHADEDVVRRLQHADSLTRAARAMAHDLNDGCTALIGDLDVLRGWVSDARRTPLIAAEAAVRRIRRAASQLEAFSAAGTMRPQERVSEVQTTEGAVIIEIVQDTVNLALNSTRIRASFAIDGALPAVAAEGGAISHAVYNLVVNAVDAMDGEGTVHVEVRRTRPPDGVAIIVRDDGPGLDQSLLDHVFRPYFTTRDDRAGMGLTVALSLIEATGGSITLATEPGFGTTATIRLAAVGRTTAAEIIAPAHRDAVALDTLLVLLIEDDPLVRRGMQRSLESLGCRVVAADSGDRGIELFMKQDPEDPFDVLVTDLTMPGRSDGMQVLRRVREFDPMLPAVLSSGTLHRPESPSFHEAGFQVILRKPFGEAEIRNALIEAVSLAQREF